jgi:hypothetical protein
VHSTGTDSETVWGAATVSAPNGSSAAAVQGGFQLTATTSGATRVDN